MTTRPRKKPQQPRRRSGPARKRRGKARAAAAALAGAPRARASVPAEGLLTQAQYARHRGVSREAVRKAVRDGRIRMTRAGLIDREAADAAWRANTDPFKPSSTALRTPGEEPAQGPAAPPSPEVFDAAASGVDQLPPGMTLLEARALKEWNTARTLDLKRRQLEGKLVELEKVEDAAFRAARTARDLLMAIPDRLDATLAACTDAAEVNRMLSEELRQICDEFARGMRAQHDDEEDPAA